MVATKEQELKALEQIKKIINGLGEDSYVGTAFEGCFEIAEENIRNDWACSMKQRAESAEKSAREHEKLCTTLMDAKNKAIERMAQLEEELKELKDNLLTEDDIFDCCALVDGEIYETDKDRKSAAMEIVTFAEETSGANFQNAVKRHRAAERKWNYLLGLKSRLEKVPGRKN